MMTHTNYVVYIRDRTTGFIRSHKPLGVWCEIQEFMWSEGDYACDCNRSLFYHGDAIPEVECTDFIYDVCVISEDPVEILYDEGFAEDVLLNPRIVAE